MKINKPIKILGLMIIALTLAGTVISSGNHSKAEGGEVNLYSYRQPFLIKPILDKFTEKTGIKVNVVYAKRGMLERIKAEGAGGAADAGLVEVRRLQKNRGGALGDLAGGAPHHPGDGDRASGVGDDEDIPVEGALYSVQRHQLLTDLGAADDYLSLLYF